MKNLLRYEFRKLIRNPLFYILFGAMIALILIQAFSYKLLNDLVMPAIDTEEESNMLIESMSIAASTFYMQCLTQSNCTIIIAIFSALIMLMDNSGPIKNVIARGYSRTDVYLSKYVVSTSVALIYAILIIIASYPITVFILGTPKDLPDNFVLLLIGQVAAVAALNSVFCMLSVLIGKIVLVIFINVLAPQFITLILSLIDSLSGLEEVTSRGFWVDGILSTFAGAPSDVQIVISFIMAAVYVAAGIFLGMLFSKKKQY